MKFFAVILLLLSMRSEANQCANDSKKFCSGIEPGKGQIAKCLSEYQDQLSPACAKDLKDYKSKTSKKNPCFEDLADFCINIPAEARKLDYCLLKHESRLGPTCSKDFKQRKGNLIVKDVCAQDIVNTCYASVNEPEGAIVRCLIKNRPKLSGNCQKTIDKKMADMKKNNPCFDETEKFCPTQVQFVDIHECMVKKLGALSPLCKKVVQEEINKEKANPCYMDLRKHCKKGLSSTEQHHCLTLNEKVLSNACNQFRAQEGSKLKKMVEACEPDRLKLCPTSPFQNGLVLKCLKENISKVSPACKALM